MFPDDHPLVVNDMSKRMEKTASLDLPRILLTSRSHGQTLHVFTHSL